MPYAIIKHCAGNQTIREDVCPYDAIKQIADGASSKVPQFRIVSQYCTDCGACALACPTAAIEPGRPAARIVRAISINARRYQPQPLARPRRSFRHIERPRQGMPQPAL